MAISTAQWQQMGHRRSLAGHDIFCIDNGRQDAPVILLLHGYPTSSWDWEALWSSLDAEFRLVALDMLGFGFSEKPFPCDYPIARQADIVEALVEQLELTQFHVLAHDYGDTVAQELLARQNALARPQWLSLCCLNGGLFPETHHARPVQRLLLSPLGGLLTLLIREKQLRRTLTTIFGPQTPPSAQLVHDFWNLISHNNGRRVMRGLISYMPQRIRCRERWVGALQNSRVPVALINGAMDPVSGVHMVARYREVVGEPAFLLSLPRIGHYPQVEAAREVEQGYREFLRRVGE
jgi:pimeloyl-ACP methyl ester carboxylesterase